MYAPLPNVNAWNASLEELNDEEVKTLIPAIIYTSLLMVCGVIGNALVLYVYCFRFKASNHRYFILTLGVCDFITSAVCMPFLIADELLPFMFTNIIACKSLRYITYNTAIVSIFTLFVIGVDRYRKICQPLDKQITLPLARRILFGIVLLTSTVFALPSFILYGHTSIYTGHSNLSGIACFIDDQFNDTSIPLAYNTALFAMVFVLGSAMVYCYSRIAHQRLLRAKFKHARRKYFGVENSDRFLSSDHSGKDIHTSALNELIEEFNESVNEGKVHTHTTVFQKLNTVNEHNNQEDTFCTKAIDKYNSELSQTSNEFSEEHDTANIEIKQAGTEARNYMDKPTQNGIHCSKTNHFYKRKNTSVGDLCTVIQSSRKNDLRISLNTQWFSLAINTSENINGKIPRDLRYRSFSVPNPELTFYDIQVDNAVKCIEHDKSLAYGREVFRKTKDNMSKSYRDLFPLCRSQTESSVTKVGLKQSPGSCHSETGDNCLKQKQKLSFSDTYVYRNNDYSIDDKEHARSCDSFDLNFKEGQYERMILQKETFTTQDKPQLFNQNRRVKNSLSEMDDEICSKYINFDRNTNVVSDLLQDEHVVDPQSKVKAATISVTKENEAECSANGIFEKKGSDTPLLNGNMNKMKKNTTHTRFGKAFIKRNQTKSAKFAENRDISLIRVTKMLFVITIVYFISFIPHLALMIYLMLDEEFLLKLDRSEAAVFYIALRSFLINAVANPFIYNFMDRKFRKECRKLYIWK